MLKIATIGAAMLALTGVVHAQTTVTIGQVKEIDYSFKFLDSKGNPLQPQPTPSAPPTWTNAPSAAGVDRLTVAADKMTAVLTPLAAGTDTVTVSAATGGKTFTANNQVIVQGGTQAPAAASISLNPVVIPITSGGAVQTPGPSAALYNSPLYYSCQAHISVANITQFNTQVGANHNPGDCIDIAPGVYTLTGTNPARIANGGSAPTASAAFPATTYVVWRCTSMPFSFAAGALQGEGSGCVFRQSGSQGGALFYTVPSYTMFDGLEFDGNSNAVGQACIDDERSNGTHHHIWILNSDFHGCGQSGIQFNQTEWLYVIHSVWHDNSNTNGVSGSGLSFYQPVLTPSYTVTAQDNAFQSSTAGTTFHIVVDYNVGFHNFNNFTGCTDGEGIIFDDFGWEQAAGTPYTGSALAMGNVMYFNGGGGVQMFSQNPATGQTWFVNNTTYNNYWSTCNTGTWRADNYLNVASKVHVINNISYAVIGSGINANNAAFIGKQPTAAGGSGGNVWQNNVAFPDVLASPAAGFDAPNTFPTAGTNKNLNNTDPKFTSVSASSAANNFALQSTSPAIGAGQVFDLWQQSGTVDAGACPRSAPGPVANCP